LRDFSKKFKKPNNFFSFLLLIICMLTFKPLIILKDRFSKLTQKKAKNKITRFLLLICGYLSIALAVLGAFLPLLPTTVFLLLAAYFFSKSSDKMHNWLLSNKWFGSYIKNYQEGRGIPLHSKITAILSMWLLMIASGIWATDLLIVRILLFLVGTGVTIHLLRMPTFRETKNFQMDLNKK
jgi:uncharacterized membrane protein YbaN (DUF454 family)